MNRDAWRSLKGKIFFSSEDVAGLFGLKTSSAQVFCSRMVKRGAFIRLKKDFYVAEERWPYLDRKEFFFISNHLQVPSYISFTTALVYHEVSTQSPQGWLESAALKRSVQYTAGGTSFSYFKLKRDLYFGFVKTGTFFMALKEKAFLDVCHLSVYGRYACDWAALDLGSLNKKVMETLMPPFPERTRDRVKEVLKGSV
jgi:hypothetical protein